jgi:hypothetical protein
MIIDEIKNIKQYPRDLRKFGLTIGTIILLIACFLIWKHKHSGYYFLLIGDILAFFGIFFPIILRPIHKVWMTISILLGWVMTRVILSVLFYLVITPISLIARISGKQFLDLQIDKSRASYWEKRKNIPPTRKDYERQF